MVSVLYSLCSIHDMIYTVFETRNTKHETRNTKHETRNTKHETRMIEVRGSNPQVGGTVLLIVFSLTSLHKTRIIKHMTREKNHETARDLRYLSAKYVIRTP